MPTIPIIVKDAQTQALPTRQFGASLPNSYGDVPKPDNSGMDAVAQSIMDVQQKFQKQDDEIAALKSQQYLDDWENRTLYDPQNGAFTKKGRDALGLSQSMSVQFDKDSEDFAKDFSPSQRQIFEKQRASRRSGIVQRVQSHESDERQKYMGDQSKALIDASKTRAANNYNNPAIVLSSRKNIEDEVYADSRRLGRSDEQHALAVKKETSDMHVAMISRMADTDPPAAVKYFEQNKGDMDSDGLTKAYNLIQPVQKAQRVQSAAARGTAAMQPKTTAQGAIAFVMSKDIEGGDTVVQDGDGVTKYGINGKSNGLSDDEVRALTPDKAAALYKANYWDAIKADTLPENIRLLAFDAAVNQGVGTAQEMLQASGGDPQKFIKLREERYRETAQNPAKAQYLQGWLNRLDKVSAATATTTPSELEAIQAIQAGDEPPEDKADAVKLFQSGLKAQRDAVENSNNDFLVRVIPLVQQLNGNWSMLPPSILAEAKQRGVMDKLAAYKGVSDPQVLLKISSMPSSDFARYDLRQDILSLSVEDYQKYSNDQKTVNKAGAANVRDQILKVGKESLLAAGFNPSPNGSDAAAEAKKLLPFLQSAEQAVQAYRDTHGKDPSDEELQKITDKLLLKGVIQRNGKKYIWGGGESAYAFQKHRGDVFVMEVPDSVKLAVAAYATDNRLGTDEETLKNVYTRLRDKGMTDAQIMDIQNVGSGYTKIVFPDGGQ